MKAKFIWPWTGTKRSIPRVVLLSVLVGSLSGLPVSAKVAFRTLKGRPYAAVRAQLTATGYTPVRFKHPNVHDACAGQDWCALYPEALYCSGTGINICEFYFFDRKSRKYLAVFTYGETRLTVDEARPISKRETAYWPPETH